MQRKSFDGMPCPIARSLERVGEWWSILILRDALHGMTRFDEFQKSLGIAPNMLTRRLNALVEAGLLERRRYSEQPPRDEYVLTARGARFPPGAAGAARLGQPPFRAGGRERRSSSTPQTGAAADPVLVDRATGAADDRRRDYAFAAGPAARRAHAAPLRAIAADAAGSHASRRRAAGSGPPMSVATWPAHRPLRSAARPRTGRA